MDSKTIIKVLYEKFGLTGSSDGTYEDLRVDGNKPTKEEFEQACLEYEAEQKATEYKILRATEYPTLEECIHALLDGGDTLAELNEKRQAVKLKYPKG